MNVTRRSFLKITGSTVAALGMAELGMDMAAAAEQAKALKTANIKPVATICPYCSVGCGITMYIQDGKIVSSEGDADHPINQGSLCSKGSSVGQIHQGLQGRVTKPLYRAPGSDKFEEKDWEWVLTEMTKRIKETRDKTFIHKEGDLIVNRTDAIAMLGGAALDNEECYLQQKMGRGLGMVYIEHQARI